MLGIESAERVRITESEGTEHEDRSKEEDACKRGRRERQREREKKKKDKQERREERVFRSWVLDKATPPVPQQR